MEALVEGLSKELTKNRHASSTKSKDIFSILPNGLTLLDIGAAGGVQPRWEKVCKYLNYIGVEPDARSNDNLADQNIFRTITILDAFAWSEEAEIQFNLCKKPRVSSAFKPNRKLLDIYPDSSRFDVIGKEYLKGEPLFNKTNEYKIDFAKLDIQGGELDALIGLGSSLDGCLGLEVEVEFSEMYNSQPLFGDINQFLSSRGFYFCDFVKLARWERHAHNDFGRCLFGDGLWLKDLNNLDTTHAEECFKYAAICSLYGKLDEAIHLLKSTPDKATRKLLNLLHEQLTLQTQERMIFAELNEAWFEYGPGTRMHLME